MAAGGAPSRTDPRPTRIRRGVRGCRNGPGTLAPRSRRAPDQHRRGILKFRLYEIDRLISRTISYAILTATLIGVFAGIVG